MDFKENRAWTAEGRSTFWQRQSVQARLSSIIVIPHAYMQEGFAVGNYSGPKDVFMPAESEKNQGILFALYGRCLLNQLIRLVVFAQHQNIHAESTKLTALQHFPSAQCTTSFAVERSVANVFFVVFARGAGVHVRTQALWECPSEYARGASAN